MNQEILLREKEITGKINQMPDKVYSIDQIFDFISQHGDFTKNELRWTLSYLTLNSKNVKRISRGLYGINLDNNAYQKILSEATKKFSINQLFAMNSAFLSFESALYKKNVFEGIPVRETYIVDSLYKNKVTYDSKNIAIKYKKIDKNARMGLVILREYMRKINSSSYKELPVIFDVIKKYKITVTEANDLMKSKNRLLHRIFDLSLSYNG